VVLVEAHLHLRHQELVLQPVERRLAPQGPHRRLHRPHLIGVAAVVQALQAPRVQRDRGRRQDVRVLLLVVSDREKLFEVLREDRVPQELGGSYPFKLEPWVASMLT